ncbi:MAG: BTAD domain-containing putative transcriptional regulator [Actinomycetota bacterium]
MLVRAFGAIDVATSDGTREPVGGRRQRLILALLVSRLGDVVPDDVITEAIWGDGAPPSARTAVQTYLSGLRDLLEPDRARHSAGSFISHEGGGYRLALGPEQLDVARFVSDVDEAARIHSSDRAAATALLDRALDLWAEPPLAEFADEPWALAAVAGWRDERATAIEARVGFALDAGAEQKVLPLLRAAVADYPYRERLAGQMMLVLYRSGEQREALAEYGRIRRALHDDLGLDPGRELQLLERAILDQDPVLLRRDATAAATPVAARGDGLPAARRLVGRDEELSALEGMLTEHRCVAVVGPGGAGKSALAVTAARRFQKRFDVAVVHVDLARHRGRDPLRAIAAERRVVEHPLAPLAATVSDALGQRPTLLVLETCEVDPEGVAAAVEALAAVPGLRVLLTSQVATGGRDVHVLRLGGLAPDAASELLSRSLDREESPEVLAEIAEQLGGLPLGLELAASRLAALGAVELLRGMRNDPELLSATAAADDRHRSVRAAADWSIGLLAPDAAAGLTRLAGFSGPFTLRAARAILDDDDGASTVRFVGDLVERSLVARLDGTPARFRLPDSVADAVEQADADGARAARVAVAHLVLDAARRDFFAPKQATTGRAPGDGGRGDRSVITDPVELADLDHEVLPALAVLADASDARELQLAGLLGTHFQRTGRISEGRERIERALSRHPDAVPVVVCASAAQAGFLAWYQGDGRACAQLLDRIESQLDDVPLPGFADTVRGCRAFSRQEYAVAADHLAAAAEMSSGGTQQRMQVLHTAGNAAWYADRLDTAADLYAQQGDIADDVGDEFTRAQSLRFGAMLAASRGEIDRAWRWAERSRHTAVRIADPLSQAQSAVAVAVVAWRSGDGPAMETAAAEAIGHSRHHFDVFALRTALPLLAGRCLELDRPDAAAELLGWYLDLLERTGQGASMAVRDVADQVERDVRAAFGPADFSRVAGRGAARTIRELADAVR